MTYNTLDTKSHLRDRISHYDLILQQNKMPLLNSFIEEEKHLCIQHLRRLQEIDVIALIEAKRSAFRFLHTKST